MLEPLVSVVMSAYNCEKFIMQAIDSILNQTYSNFEFLIADDGSLDNTKIKIDSYIDKRIKHFHNGKNLGYLKTCNKLFKHCKGDFITFQDADDWSEPNRLYVLLKNLMKDDELYAVGSAVNKVDIKGNIRRVSYPLVYDEIFFCISHQEQSACTGTIMFKREVLNTIGGYRLFFDGKCNEDVDWLYRIMQQYKFINIVEPLYNYRSNPESMTNQNSIKRIVSRKIVHILGIQRKNYGADLLSQGKEFELESIEEELILKFNESGIFDQTIEKTNRALINGNTQLFYFNLKYLLRNKFYHPKTYIIILVSLLKYFFGIEKYYQFRIVIRKKIRILWKNMFK